MDSIRLHELLVVLLICLGIRRVSTTCQNKYVLNRGLSCEVKDLIMNMHNELRQSVALGHVHGQPSASSMMLLTWDEELARKSQSLADSCHYGHDSNQARAVTRFYVGQNIATTWSTWERSPEPDFATQIKAWFDEVGIFSFNTGFTHATGHYSQMVWGDTYLIGCGYTYYYDGYRYQKIYVCNYGPGGNVRGKPPYYPGRPSCYENGMIGSSRYYGLCDSYRTYYPDYQCTRFRRGTGNELGPLRKPIIDTPKKVKQTPKKNAEKPSKKNVKEMSKKNVKQTSKKNVTQTSKKNVKQTSKKPVKPHSVKTTPKTSANLSSKH